MAPRANWKGYLKLSLVSCAVALYPASSSSSRVSFNTLNRQTGNKVKRIYVDPDTGEEVPGEDQVKGYAVAKNAYVLVEDDELDAVKIESTHTVDIEKFVPRSEIDPRYMDAPYYIAPDDRVAQEAFAVIREAMRDSGMVALARVVIARRERILMIEPWDKGLLGTVLRYGYEVRDAAAYFEDIPDLTIPAEMKDLAHVIVDRKAGHWVPAEFEDRYEAAVVEMLRSKQAGAPVVEAAAAPRPQNVVNLMDALRKSLETERAAVAEAKPKPIAASKARSTKEKAPAPAKAKGSARKRG
ncbi:non-homologous end joining protein Ku [Alsobacter sp. SYSU BS001988]